MTPQRAEEVAYELSGMLQGTNFAEDIDAWGQQHDEIVIKLMAMMEFEFKKGYNLGMKHGQLIAHTILTDGPRQ